MGSLGLPSSGPVYTDTDTLISSVETHAVYWSVLQPLWQAAQAGTVSIVSSELALMEALIDPLRSGDAVLLMANEQVFQAPEMHLVPVSESILREAAPLRAAIPARRTPDALRAATAAGAGCALFLSNDVAFRRIAGLPVVILDEVVAAP